MLIGGYHSRLSSCSLFSTFEFSRYSVSIEGGRNLMCYMDAWYFLNSACGFHNCSNRLDHGSGLVMTSLFNIQLSQPSWKLRTRAIGISGTSAIKALSVIPAMTLFDHQLVTSALTESMVNRSLRKQRVAILLGYRIWREDKLVERVPGRG